MHFEPLPSSETMNQILDKTYDHAQVQLRTINLWDSENIYAYQVPLKGQKLYSVDTPPPTVSGSLHIGHIFSYTQTDMIVRYHRMCGEAVFYPMGFDDNGLATIRFVEKARGVSSHKMKRSEFTALCLEETVKAEAQFKDLWQKIGLSVDWNSLYSTIDERSRFLAQKSFIELYNKGFVYRRDEVTPFCTCCRTSVAQAELDDKEVSSKFYDIAFSVDGVGEVIIATTRPELLFSCVAVLYNPTDARYTNLQGKQARVALTGKYVPIIADEKVLIDKGSGLVMCCTFGDSTDVAWYKEHKLPYIQSIGLDGIFLPNTDFLAGLKVEQARERMVERLKSENLIKAEKAITHAVHIHERCKNAVEYVSLQQWFVKIVEHKPTFLALADQINWYPSFMKVRYQNWVEGVSWDWCISRQKGFGISFPVWHCRACGEVLIAPVDRLPIDPQESEYGLSCSCGSTDIIPDTDVMDTWNTSSISPYLCTDIMHGKKDDVFAEGVFESMSMRPQAHDIIRTWAFYTIVKAWMHSGVLPWNNIVISGHVLSSNKEKISKSQGNSPLDPQKLLERYSADAIRYWSGSGALGQDTAFSEDQLKQGNRSVVKLWNALRFISEHRTVGALPPKLHGTVNRWIMHRASQTLGAYKDHFEKNEFSRALETVEQFFWRDVCDNYLEMVKDMLFKPEQYDQAEVESTKLTLNNIGLRLIQLYAPFMPYVTEELYQQMYRSDAAMPSIHATSFAVVGDAYVDERAVQIVDILQQVVSSVRRMKTESKLSLKTPLIQLLISVSGESIESLKKVEHIVRGVCTSASVSYTIEPLCSEYMRQDGDGYRMAICLNTTAQTEV
ncbi:MAG: Valine-tRNA ligase [candidate division TM6 bacterium GW2011_GWE2_41_16]|nr:MAG: Valine-tRNA ligase [candidate division TM6 bacterium GW2011_GWE2_41_16]